MRLIDADKVNSVFKILSEKGTEEGKVIWDQCVDIIYDIETVKAIPVWWIQLYIWEADTHEEKQALRKMYIQWEKENARDN